MCPSPYRPYSLNPHYFCMFNCKHFQATFPSLAQSLSLTDNNLWGHFNRSSQCEQEFPTSLDKKVTPFQQVYIVFLLILHLINADIKYM